MSHLAAHIEHVASSKSAHDSYLYFKLSHGYTRAQLAAMPIADLIRVAKKHMRTSVANTTVEHIATATEGYANDYENYDDLLADELFFSQIVAKEKYDSKHYCCKN